MTTSSEGHVLLQRALRCDDIGAKTTAGYGRLDLRYTGEAERTAEAAARQTKALAAEQPHRMGNLLAALKPGTVVQVLPQVFAMPDGPARVAQLLAGLDAADPGEP